MRLTAPRGDVESRTGSPPILCRFTPEHVREGNRCLSRECFPRCWCCWSWLRARRCRGRRTGGDFWALNSTGREIREFYVSPHDNTRWGSDVLGRATLPNGVGTIVTFSPESQTGCIFDFKLVFDDGTSVTYTQGRNVCRVDAILFNPTESFGLSRP